MLTFLTLTLLYFLPTLVGRHKYDAVGIFVVNLLFGWTVIGWMIALMWACSAEPRVHYVPVTAGRFCCQCGSLSPAGAHFCPGCGHLV